MGITGRAGGEPTKVGVAISDIVAACSRRTPSWLPSICAATGRARASRFPLRVNPRLARQPRSGVPDSGEDTGLIGNAHPSIVPYQTFDASDKPIVVAVGNNTQFAGPCARP